ncbi:class I SAM-dependent methyltransferase [Paraburkholderia mimosarum]|uniref:class I SAM-dependent methyltransferase n=1 Tax=Paraburkholderia mimosarum TaxID=312026 RepID=UPI0003FFB2BD|nr:class I SAM-dependent methyltransferase [Paraburkholderia mimosarum]
MEIPSEWTFRSNEVAGHFDAHVREQLPWYDLTTEAVAHFARHYIPEAGRVYDVGCSTGNIGRALASTLESRRAEFVALDSSQEMTERYSGPGKCVCADALAYAFEEFDVAICFLVLMFIAPGKRREFLRSLCNKLRPGGALIVFDKMDCAGGGYLSTAMHRLTMAGKLRGGASAAEIIAKELSISGVQRPLPWHFMTMACPNAVEVFRFGEFAGWVIEAPE